eukprot:1139249-Pelagomonas_calceolata.AAC.8
MQCAAGPDFAGVQDPWCSCVHLQTHSAKGKPPKPPRPIANHVCCMPCACVCPQSMEPLRGLQRALTKSAAPLSASTIAAEATMLLQPPHQQQQQSQHQDAQHPLQEAQAQQGEARTSSPSPATSPVAQQQQQRQQQEEEQGVAAPGASSPTPPLAPVTDPRAAAAFGSKSRSEVVAVALRIANTLLGRAHAAAANPPPAFVLELVHRPPTQVTAPPPSRPQPRVRSTYLLVRTRVCVCACARVDAVCIVAPPLPVQEVPTTAGCLLFPLKQQMNLHHFNCFFVDLQKTREFVVVAGSCMCLGQCTEASGRGAST